MNGRNRILVALVLLLSVFSLYAEDIRIEPEKAVIVCFYPAVKAAAEDLQLHLKIITGKEIPLKPLGFKDKLPEGFLFLVGKAPDGTPNNFEPEEARWKASPEAVWFYGHPNRGAMHAVYMFLEDELGVRWPWNHAISAPEQQTITVKHTEGQWIPKLKIRKFRQRGGGRSPWDIRLRVGSHNPPPYGHAYADWWDKYGKDHPEYFALNDGKRQPAAFDRKTKMKYPMCVSCEAFVDQIIANWGGKGAYINICENDAPDNLSCHCDECRKLDALKPGEKFNHNLADRYIVFANRVLARARAKNPDVKVSMYAYNASQDAPRREKVDKDIVIGIVPTAFSLEAIRKYVGSWKAVGMNEFYYRPNRHYYYSAIMPFGCEKHFYQVFQYLCEQNAIGFDYDCGAPYRYYSNLMDYVIYKGFQDPSRPFEYWEQHYMQAFAPAEKEIAAYFRYWREEVWEKRLAKDQQKLEDIGKCYNFARGLTWHLKEYYKDEDFKEAGKHLDEALKRTDLSPNVRKLIEALRNENEHTRLIFRAIAYKNDADSKALLQYRQAHKMPLFQGSEQHFGDVCGIRRVQNLAEYDPPYIPVPVLWKFRLDPDDVGLREQWFLNQKDWKDVMGTDQPWENPAWYHKAITPELRKQTANYDGIAWYAKNVRIDPELKGRKIFLLFQAVDESAWIWFNGKKAGEHLYKNKDDWRTPFAIRIDELIDWNAKEQNIVVRVEDRSGLGGVWKPVYIVTKAE